MQRFSSIIAAVSVVAAFASANLTDTSHAAGHSCCAHCGCEASCRQVCRLVCEEKKVEVVCWGCQCEDFCLPGPGKPQCKKCEMVCADCSESCDAGCDCTKPHAEPKRFVWTSWLPSCAEIHTKKKLMKKVVTKKVPTYKFVVEELCPACAAGCQETHPDAVKQAAASAPIEPTITR